WVERLRGLGVDFQMNHRLVRIERAPLALEFANGRRVTAESAVLALGGGSWPNTGSDGAWLPMLEARGISIAALEPATCGWEHPWPADVVARIEGTPLKNLHVSAAGVTAIGELLVTRHGLEG